ncbi:hypothetical protein GCM10018987_07260 [Streptomyces cremeus]
MDMTRHHITLAASKLTRFTDVGWLDFLLNAALYLGFLGVGVWITWWWQERKRGVRGAAEKHRLAVGRRMRTRRILAALSMVGALAQIGVGIALTTRSDPDDDGQFLLVTGGLVVLAWLFALPLCRPLPRPADDRSVKHAPTREKPYDQVSYDHLPAKVPDQRRNR